MSDELPEVQELKKQRVRIIKPKEKCKEEEPTVEDILNDHERRICLLESPQKPEKLKTTGLLSNKFVRGGIDIEFLSLIFFWIIIIVAVWLL